MTDDKKGTPFLFGSGTGSTNNSNVFSFGSSNTSTPPTFGFTANKEAAKPTGFGGFNLNKKTSTPSFSFGTLPAKQNDTARSHPTFAEKRPQVTANSDSKPAFGFSTPLQSLDKKPLLSSDSRNDQTIEGNSDIHVIHSGYKYKPAPSSNKKSIDENKSIEESKASNLEEDAVQKDNDNKFMKQYQVPSGENLINDNNMDIGEDFEVKKDESDNEFYDVDIDEKTNLPIRKLKYDENEKSVVSKGEHLNFTLSNKNEQGVLFVTQPEDTLKNKTNSDKDKTELFPFDLLPQLDKSSEYREFLNILYKEFEPLLLNKQYKHYLELEDDEYSKIGVLSTIQQEREERQIFLRKLMSSMLSNLKNLINVKMSTAFADSNDQWVVNDEQIINVLYLLNALNFGDNNETIVLFQQWIERIDIQPDNELLELVFKDSDKPYQNFSFWSVYVKKFLLRGSFLDLINDLKASQYEELQETDVALFQLIEDFKNLLESYNPVTFSSDLSAFLQWKKVAVALKETANGMFTNNGIIHGEILELLHILSGSTNTIDNSSTTWYENFMGHLLYQMPSKKLIKEYITNALDNDNYEKPLPGIGTWDSICVDLFKGKYLSVIASIEALDKSIGTFLAVLMEASGLLSGYSKELSNDDIIKKTVASNGISNNIDRMVEDLALTYLNNQDLFPIGVGILVSTGSNKSREIISELLPTYDIKDSDDFEWVLSICSKLKLTQTMKTIQQIQGEKFYEKQLIPNALCCFAESNSPEKVVSTVWRLFEDALLNQGLNQELAVQLFETDISKDNAILRQSLSPLYILNEILKPHQPHDEFWFNRLIGLFEFKYLPAYYKCGLIMIIYDNLNKNVFNLDNLVRMIENLNIYEKHISKDEELKSKSSSMYDLLLKSRGSGSVIYPDTLSSLLFNVRRGIAMDVSFTFLDENMY